MPKPKISESDPLRIDQVLLDGVRGQIVLTFCPGKKQERSLADPRDRDVDADMKVIQSFGTAALVTLMEDHELREVKVPPDQLHAGASAPRLEWHYLPVRDVSFPDEHFEVLWVYSGWLVAGSGGEPWCNSRSSLQRPGQCGTIFLVPQINVRLPARCGGLPSQRHEQIGGYHLRKGYHHG